MNESTVSFASNSTISPLPFDSSTAPSQIISLFENDRNFTGSADSSSNPFTVIGALLLNGGHMTDWWELTLSILLWMTLSYVIIYLGAALIALLLMRRHPYVLLVFMGMLGMCVIGPATVGAITSLSLASALSASNKVVSPWHCMILGVSQSVILVVVSFSRLLGTL